MHAVFQHTRFPKRRCDTANSRCWPRSTFGRKNGEGQYIGHEQGECAMGGCPRRHHGRNDERFVASPQAGWTSRSNVPMIRPHGVIYVHDRCEMQAW